MKSVLSIYLFNIFFFLLANFGAYKLFIYLNNKSENLGVLIFLLLTLNCLQISVNFYYLKKNRKDENCMIRNSYKYIALFHLFLVLLVLAFFT
jgi:hypothetical protein